jgi:hypothetical protein
MMRLHQFLQLWTNLDEVQLPSAPDSILWLPEANGIYSAKSTYKIQFAGTIQQPHLEKNSGKQKLRGKSSSFFGSCCVINSNWTADRLPKRGLPCNPICSLCDQELEYAVHLTVGCSFVKEIWEAVQGTNASLPRLSSRALTVKAWWGKIQSCVPKDQRKETITLACYTVWHIWKERGRRVFEGKELRANALAGLVKDEVAMASRAFLM